MKIEKKAKKSTLLGNIFFGLLIVSIIGSALIFATSQNPGKSIFGYRFYNVLTNSMSPVMTSGDIVFVKQTDVNDLQINDIITYATSDGKTFVTHRISAVYSYEEVKMFNTKGDANKSSDIVTVLPENVVGKVSFVLPTGKFLASFAQTTTWIFIGLGVLIILLIYILIKLLHSNAVEKKNKFISDEEGENHK